MENLFLKSKEDVIKFLGKLEDLIEGRKVHTRKAPLHSYAGLVRDKNGEYPEYVGEMVDEEYKTTYDKEKRPMEINEIKIVLETIDGFKQDFVSALSANKLGIYYRKVPGLGLGLKSQIVFSASIHHFDQDIINLVSKYTVTKENLEFLSKFK
ncbi:MAG: hypothetical protein OEX08_02860 [Candidatus Nomurabacteria bacterium]|nr:hypothetical protein [Candidatus Nomurabacteria bacterium]